MSINFKYIPPSPEPISGQAFIQQTEQAVNELGELAEASQSMAAKSLALAQNAQITANDALSSAQDAQSVAGHAQNSADSAMTSAESALALGHSAINTAHSAYDSAIIANSKADTAGTVADEALSTADAALLDAQTAQKTADDALVFAQAAQEAADQANGVYQTYNTDDPDLEPLDLNELYQSPIHLHVTGNTGAANLPAGASLPVFFDLRVDDDNTAARQTATAPGGTRIWTRSGQVVIDQDDAAKNRVSWTDWLQIADEAFLTDAYPNGQDANTWFNPGLWDVTGPSGNLPTPDFSGALNVVVSRDNSAAYEYAYARTGNTIHFRTWSYMNVAERGDYTAAFNALDESGLAADVDMSLASVSGSGVIRLTNGTGFAPAAYARVGVNGTYLILDQTYTLPKSLADGTVQMLFTDDDGSTVAGWRNIDGTITATANTVVTQTAGAQAVRVTVEKVTDQSDGDNWIVVSRLRFDLTPDVVEQAWSVWAQVYPAAGGGSDDGDLARQAYDLASEVAALAENANINASVALSTANAAAAPATPTSKGAAAQIILDIAGRTPAGVLGAWDNGGGLQQQWFGLNAFDFGGKELQTFSFLTSGQIILPAGTYLGIIWGGTGGGGGGAGAGRHNSTAGWSTSGGGGGSGGSGAMTIFPFYSDGTAQNILIGSGGAGGSGGNGGGTAFAYGASGTAGGYGGYTTFFTFSANGGGGGGGGVGGTASDGAGSASRGAAGSAGGLLGIFGNLGEPGTAGVPNTAVSGGQAVRLNVPINYKYISGAGGGSGRTTSSLASAGSNGLAGTSGGAYFIGPF